jgi:uncharacterized membrane protein YqiK
MTGSFIIAAGNALPILGGIAAIFLLGLFVAAFLGTRYKRCPSNRILVKWGRGTGNQAGRCYHGGAVLSRRGDVCYAVVSGLCVFIARTSGD